MQAVFRCVCEAPKKSVTSLDQKVFPRDKIFHKNGNKQVDYKYRCGVDSQHGFMNEDLEQMIMNGDLEQVFMNEKNKYSTHL